MKTECKQDSVLAVCLYCFSYFNKKFRIFKKTNQWHVSLIGLRSYLVVHKISSFFKTSFTFIFFIFSTAVDNITLHSFQV